MLFNPWNLTVTEQNKLEYFRNQVLGWYKAHGRAFPWRNKSSSNYQLIVSEVLLQRTRAETVAKNYRSFFKKYSSWKKLASASEEEISEFIKPLGLWQRRARSLSLLAKKMTEMNGRFPSDMETITQLPNVGQYIANAVLLFCKHEPRPLLDTNMARVLERFFGPRKLSDIRYDPYLQALAMSVVQCKYPKEMNWAILDFAALICLIKKPLCNACILNKLCTFYGTQASNCNSDQPQ